MILQKLNDYYQRLANDPQIDIAKFGYSLQKISFCVVIKPDGELHEFQDLSVLNERSKPMPRQIIMPGQAKPSGSGINPCFLWDNATYMLGAPTEGRNAEWIAKRYHAFRDHHLAAESQINHPAFSAVCRFLEQWQPDQCAEHAETLQNITSNFGIFRLQGESINIHELPEVQEWWNGQIANSDEGENGYCLISGNYAPIARINEPKIKNVRGALSAGALLVSFNTDSSESFGKAQCYNAPISKAAVFQYATALNHLLASGHAIIIGDTTTAFWTEKPHLAEQAITSAFSGFLPDTSNDSQDDGLAEQIRGFLRKIRQGRPDQLAEHLENPETPFYILGLSPNTSRISVRYWHVSTVGKLASHLAKHYADLSITGLNPDIPITIRHLLDQTAPLKSGKPDREKIPPLLAGSLMNAILTNTRYPMAFLQAIIRRIRADRHVSSIRAAAIKASLIRNFQYIQQTKEIDVALDEQRKDTAYLLGRWFAILEKIQKDALGENLNTTIKDRFLTAASSTPAAVFPRMIQLSHHHLKKIESAGIRINHEKRTQQIASMMSADPLPRHLPIDQQGLFFIGYYHQNQDLYTSKKNNNSGAQNDAASKESE